MQFLAGALDAVAGDDSRAISPTSMRFLVAGLRKFSIREHAALCQLSGVAPIYHGHGIHDSVIQAETAGLTLQGAPAHFILTPDHIEFLAFVQAATATVLRKVAGRAETRLRSWATSIKRLR